jgi:5'-deoxynucleotidase YfbR-like HD superfamily hydrolase
MEISQVNDQPHPQRVLTAIRDQSNVKRYNLFPTLRESNDAEHTGRAAQIMVLVIHDLKHKENIVDVNPLRETELLTHIILHDLGESIMGDTPYPVKSWIPTVRDTEDNAVAMLLRGLPSRVRAWLLESGDPWKLIVKAVDMAELVMYCTTEYQMGNTLIEPCLRTGSAALFQYIEKLASKGVTHVPTLQAIVDDGLSTLEG